MGLRCPLFCYMEIGKLQQHIHNLAQKACADLNLFLIDAKVRGTAHKPQMDIIADSESGITLKDCENLTRAMQDLLDVDEIITGNYRLNVSSPGVDRPLVEDYEFSRNIGHLIVVKLQSEEGEKQIIGKLGAFNDDFIELEQEKEKKEIKRSEVEWVKVKIQW